MRVTVKESAEVTINDGVVSCADGARFVLEGGRLTVTACPECRGGQATAGDSQAKMESVFALYYAHAPETTGNAASPTGHGKLAAAGYVKGSALHITVCDPGRVTVSVNGVPVSVGPRSVRRFQSDQKCGRCADVYALPEGTVIDEVDAAGGARVRVRSNMASASAFSAFATDDAAVRVYGEVRGVTEIRAAATDDARVDVERLCALTRLDVHVVARGSAAARMARDAHYTQQRSGAAYVDLTTE